LIKTQSDLVTKSYTLAVQGDNGLFVVGKSVALSAADTLDANAENVKV
jgi:hypothetical protein